MKKFMPLILGLALMAPLGCNQSSSPSAAGTSLGVQNFSMKDGHGDGHGNGHDDGCPDEVVITEGFEDDFIANRNVPNTVDAALSSPFSAINECRPAATGFNTLRDRDITACSPGGGFTPIANVALDLTDGLSGFVTFKFKLADGQRIDDGSSVGFDVVAFGGDGGHLTKSISTDGVNFTVVGDDSDAMGTYEFAIPEGGKTIYLRLQAGSTAGIFEGIWVDNIKATLEVDCPNHKKHRHHHPPFLFFPHH